MTPPARFTCDLASGLERPLPHVWEHTMGSGHALLALRADWQRQLARCHRELGVRHVRFHGILSDDLGTLVREEGKLVYSFFNTDQICDFLVSEGVRPFVELSFMPSALASGGDTVFKYRGNVTPPKDPAEWSVLIRKLVHHWVERYGVDEVRRWYFEVWNEPNLSSFWKGTREDYFRLYEHTARAIKGVDAALRVGGPATAMNAWIPEMVEHCDRKRLPLDFVSTHHYPTDAFGRPGDDTVAQLAASRRSVLREQAARARAEAGGRPLYYTEWCTSSNPFDPLHDEPYAAAFAAKTSLEAASLVEGYGYWTFSDLFEENYFSSEPFHGGFGLLTVDGVAKPAYRAFELLHRLGDRECPVVGHHATVDAWVTRRDGALAVLLTNGALPRHPIASERVRLELQNMGPVSSATVERVDEAHANPRAAWVQMGSPSRPDRRQLAALVDASSVARETLALEAADGSAAFELELPPQAVALVTLERP